MDIDVAAKTLYVEYYARFHEYDRKYLEERWNPGCLGTDRWRTIARAVLEAAGYNEAIALVQALRDWVCSECPSILLYGPSVCEPCAYRKTCKLPDLAERTKAALQKAGKGA